MAYTAQNEKRYTEAKQAIERLSDRDLAMLIADMLSGGVDMSDDLGDLCFENDGDKLATALAEYAKSDDDDGDDFREQVRGDYVMAQAGSDWA